MITDKGIAVPEDMAEVLAADPAVLTVFQTMRPSCQREYVDWIGKSGKPEARAHRLVSLGDHVLAWGRKHVRS